MPWALRHRKPAHTHTHIHTHMHTHVHTQVVEKVAHRLMAAAVADPSERVRITVLSALYGTTALDEFLGQVRDP